MKFLKNNIGSIVSCLMEILVGILLLINPVGFTSGIIIGAGFVLLVTGLISVIKYFRTEPEAAEKTRCWSKAWLLCWQVRFAHLSQDGLWSRFL